MSSKKILVGCLAVFGACLMASSAQAGMIYGFGGVTKNNATNTSNGVNQLSVEVSDAGPGKVSFTFTNVGSAAMSITDVYFDDGTLLGIASISGGSGVSFSQYATPSDLPGGTAINFQTAEGFSADSDSPVQRNGVNPGESLTITFDLINSKNYADTLAALELGLAHPGEQEWQGTDTLRIGIHVQGFANGGSESFVNGPGVVTAVPIPAGIVLLASGVPVLFLGGLLRRRKPVAA